MNFCGWLERETPAVFIGEPSGAGVNMCGDSMANDLGYNGWRLHISTLYWQEGMPEDRRQWIHPYVEAPMSLDDIRDGWDPALDAALSFDDPQIIEWLSSTEPRRQWSGPSQRPAIDAALTWPRRSHVAPWRAAP